MPEKYGGFMKEKHKVNKIALQSRKWIIDSFLKLLQEKPYDEITITEIASEAQLARRTFYRNFNSKEEVLNLHIQRLVIQYIKLLRKEKILDVRNAAKVFFTFWKKHINFIISMDKNDLLYIVLQKYSYYLPTVHKLVKADKEYDNDETLEYVLAFSAGGFWNMLIKWERDGCKRTPEEMAALVEMIMSKDVI